ncbi:MAG: nitroreductase family protein [Chloroflexi bacterium]|nr:nitroreductase family protein [Chloroflexota bacterium]
MEIDAFLDLVRRRRSVRYFKPDPIPDEYVEKILEAGRWAMSGANGQPWEFIVVKDRAVREKIADIIKETRKHTMVIERTRAAELRHPGLDTFSVDPGFKNAPVHIVVCADPRTLQATILSGNFYGGDGGPMSTFYKNVANATFLINLAAAALGLGAQWKSINSSWEGPLRDLLGVPAPLSIHCIVPIGYPAGKSASPYRRKLSELVHQEKYDMSKYRTDEQLQEFLVDLRRRTIPGYHVQGNDESE